LSAALGGKSLNVTDAIWRAAERLRRLVIEAVERANRAPREQQPVRLPDPVDVERDTIEQLYGDRSGTVERARRRQGPRRRNGPPARSRTA
jgi:hypothetical protein